MAKMRRSTDSQTGLHAADLADFLRDRQWHKLTDLTQAVASKIDPEIAAKIFRLGGRKEGEASEKFVASRSSEPPDVQVALGRIHIVERMVRLIGEVAEKPNRNTYQMEKWVKMHRWFCWSCGFKQEDELEAGEDHICQDCAKIMAQAAGGK